MTKQQITVRVREIYGRVLYYPMDENAQLFAKIAGKTTLSKQDLNLIAGLGYKTVYNYGPPNLGKVVYG